MFLLRWFWWRVNTWSEISAMVISFLVAIYFGFVHSRLGFEAWDPSTTLVLGVAITTAGWLAVTFMTPPVDADTLRAFSRDIRPLGRGWDAVVGDGGDLGESEGKGNGELTAGLLAWFLGCTMVYGALFGTGFLLYGQVAPGVMALIVAAASGWGVFRTLPRVGFLS